MRYFLLALLCLLLPLYSTVSWLIISIPSTNRTHKELVAQFKVVHLNVFNNMRIMGFLLIVLCIVAILLFNKSKIITPELKLYANAIMILLGFILLFQGWVLL